MPINSKAHRFCSRNNASGTAVRSPIITASRGWRCGDSPSDRCGSSNFADELDRVTECLFDVDRSSGDTPVSLDAVERALSPEVSGEVGFGRDHAFLTVLFIAGNDDASAKPVGDDLEQILETKAHPNSVFVGASGTGESRRVRSVTDRAGGVSVSADAEHWSEVLLPIANSFAESLGAYCLEDSVLAQDTELAEAGRRLPCYWIRESNNPTCGLNRYSNSKQPTSPFRSSSSPAKRPAASNSASRRWGWI